MHKLNHLSLEAIQLAASQEWMDALGAWRFVRLHSGAAYWLSPGQNRPLVEGEVIILPPNAEGLVRASQIGDVVLHGFNFSPALFCGFFTVAERHFLETRGNAKSSQVQFFPSTHSVAQQFAASIASLPANNPLSLRVTALNLVATIFDEEMARHRPPTPHHNAHDRFLKFIAQMPETELINHSSDELARLCGCSSRHFNRLFQQQFGVSARARQTELRLLKSRQLLAGSDDKIVNVALESGYRNLSLFNSLFKKRFGMTPSQWRKNSAKPVVKSRRLAVFATLAFMLFSAFGNLRADETNATPVAKTNAPLTFRVDTYELDGNTLLPMEILTPVFEKHVGEAVTFETIRSALAELQMAYRARGFVTVSVSLPQQQLTNGVVQVKVTEGRLANVVVKGNKHFSVENVLRALPSARTNTLLNGLAFQQELDRANANGDRQIYPVIAPGPEPGTSVLELRVKDRLPFHMHMELNNYSTPNTPDLRMNLSAVCNNLWQRDYQLGVQYGFTPESLKDPVPENLPDEIRPYDQPLIANYSIFYRMPLAPLNGYPREYSVQDFGYDEVTHRFRPPPLTGAPELIVYASRSYSDTATAPSSQTLTPNVNFPNLPTNNPYGGGGIQISDTTLSRTLSPNENLGFRLSKPLAPLGKLTSTISIGADYKNFRSTLLQDRVFQATLYVPTSGTNGPPFTAFQSPPTFSTRGVFSSVEYLPITLDWSGAIADAHGTTLFDVSQSFNMTALMGRKSDFQTVASSTDASGNYYIVSTSFTRDQKIWRDWGVRLHADGQWANEPLISNEQFGLGGQSGVRGYRDGRQYGDCGWRAQIEPHSPFINCGLVDGTVPMLARLYAFVDYGQTFSLVSGVTPSSVSMLGAGCGVDASIGEHFDCRLQLGVPLLGVPSATTSEPFHIAFSLGIQL